MWRDLLRWMDTRLLNAGLPEAVKNNGKNASGANE